MNADKTVGARVRELRTALAMPQRRLGALVGLDAPSISRIEHGTRGLWVADVARFARALRCAPSDIVAPLDRRASR